MPMKVVGIQSSGRASGPTIERIAFRRYRIPFKKVFATSQEASEFRYGAIVLVWLAGGRLAGTGEMAPLPLSSPEALCQALVPGPAIASQLAGQTPTQALGWIGQQIQESGRIGEKVPASLVCGLETAIIDALCKSTGGASLAQALGTRVVLGELNGPPLENRLRKPAVTVNAIIGTTTITESVNSAIAAVAAGYRSLKLKVGLQGSRVEREIELVRVVRESIGPGIELRLDANGAWSLSQATTVLEACVPYDIAYIEQPLPVAELHQLPTLRERTAALIALDEAVTDYAAARRILDAGLADVLIVKPQVVGGLGVSRQIIEEAAERGVECVLTSSIESGIGIAATLQLAAALPQVRLACGLATLPLLADDLILEELSVKLGAIELPPGEGIGVTVDEAALDHYAL